MKGENITAIVRVSAEEFGLEAEKVKSIEQAFLPKIAERDGLAEVYSLLVTKEMLPELSNEARDLRLKLVKVRTGIANVHKTQKAFFLASGKYVDAWKNKETEPVLQMEEKLREIEDHFIKIEEEKKQVIANERMHELEKYEKYNVAGLGEMDEEVYTSLLKGSKVEFEEKQAEIKKAREIKAEEERKEKLYTTRKSKLFEYKAFCDITLLELDTTETIYNIMFNDAIEAKDLHEERQRILQAEQDIYKERKELLLPLSQFCSVEHLSLKTTDEEWDELFDTAEDKKADHEIEQENQRKENERLKKEAEAREDEAEKQRLQQVKEDEERKEKEEEAQRIRIEELEAQKAKKKETAEARMSQLNGIGLPITMENCMGLTTTEYLNLFEAQNIKYNKAQQDKFIAKLEKERDEKEAQEKKEREEKARAEALAPDKIRMLKLIEELHIPIPAVKSKESGETMTQVLFEFQSFKTKAVILINKLK